MGRRKKADEGIEAFNREAVQAGLTYAEMQRLETQGSMERIRAPRTERANGEPVYMTVSARRALKNLEGGVER